ncbi:hypothetical protein H6P81_004183 [Aristolochia fimbriata]|uniref:Dynein light chain n=1 Tax=Aristolochia fimbriata TaxID=158543 RepID=A0AAV7FEP8_ARIFI|nr:hypothetical protein H6P81_004183 [Aristolochia fimbriata]
MEANISHEKRRQRRDSMLLPQCYSGKHIPAAVAPEKVQNIVGPRRSHEGVIRIRRDLQRGGGGGGGGGGGMVVLEGRRKSVSHVDRVLVNVDSVAAFLQVKVMATDMPELMQVHAFRCARRTYDSLDKSSHKHIAYNIKKEFDEVYGRAWHCIVGTSFGSFVTHSTGCFLYFSMGKIIVLVFKTKVVGDEQ